MNAAHIDRIIARVDALRARGGRGAQGARGLLRDRIVLAIAGAPGSGKSTLADAVVAAIDRRDGPGTAALLPMDGFHPDNAELDARGLRAVKGAPQTFDAAGFVALVRRVRTATGDLSYPRFDRAQDRTLPGAGHLAASTPVVVCEGNYLLLRAAPWSDLAPLFDLTVMLSVPLPVLRDRLVARWRDHGLTERAAAARADANDIPNARTVIDGSSKADIVLHHDDHANARGATGPTP